MLIDTYLEFADPILVSVIIPTYVKHHKCLRQAVDSVDFPNAEIIIVNDSPEAPITTENECIIVINRASDEPKYGAGGGRNKGASIAKGECLLFLDSDDFMTPNSIRYMWNAYRMAERDGEGRGVIYGDVIRTDMGQVSPRPAQYRGADIQRSPFLIQNSVMPPVILVPKTVFDCIGGYPAETELTTLEELVFEADLYANCVPCKHIDVITYVYRWSNDGRRSLSEPNEVRQAVQEFMYNRYHDYFNGTKTLPFNGGVDEMACGTCGGKPSYVVTKPNTSVQSAVLPEPTADEVLYIAYTDTNPTINIKGPATQLPYRWTRSSRNNRRLVVDKDPEWVDVNTEIHIEDAKIFANMRKRHGQVFTAIKEVVVSDEPVVVEPNQLDVSATLEKPVAEIVNMVVQQKFTKPEMAKLFATELKAEKPRITLTRVLEKALGV